ncbi:STAS domain-containing protein [Nonomuraea sp. NN258]|uniref:STAS domain-containing protein n=1 Tax=Nonomuraea antri TaxID=2730852 RepID=UPI00156889DB|nr:STAS domain-containing protein [Nonomuraea antri]NRQ40423.1 STAS domain-containing protein [Nonomuraea antri]
MNHDALHLSVRREGDVLLLRPSGELSWNTVSPLREWLAAYERRPAPVTVVDLSAVTGLDAVGLSVLLSARVRVSGRALAYAAPATVVADMLHVTGVAAHVTLYDSVQAATAAISAGRNGQTGGLRAPHVA